jgi:hypothetical protein
MLPEAMAMEEMQQPEAMAMEEAQPEPVAPKSEERSFHQEDDPPVESMEHAEEDTHLLKVRRRKAPKAESEEFDEATA